eukprot:gene11265-19623_t
MWEISLVIVVVVVVITLCCCLCSVKQAQAKSKKRKVHPLQRSVGTNCNFLSGERAAGPFAGNGGHGGGARSPFAVVSPFGRQHALHEHARGPVSASPMHLSSPHGMSAPNRSLRREMGGGGGGPADQSNLDSTEHWTTFNQTRATHGEPWSPSPNQTAATDSTLGFSTMLPHLAAPLLGLGVPSQQQHRLSPVQQSPRDRHWDQLHAAAGDLEARIGATADALGEPSVSPQFTTV